MEATWIKTALFFYFPLSADIRSSSLVRVYGFVWFINENNRFINYSNSLAMHDMPPVGRYIEG